MKCSLVCVTHMKTGHKQNKSKNSIYYKSANLPPYKLFQEYMTLSLLVKRMAWA